MLIVSDISARNYRVRRFQIITSDLLVPGDLVELSHLPLSTTSPDSNLAVAAVPPNQSQSQTSIPIPCDCLILSGTAVVNEASLTGESVPQMKDQLDASGDIRRPLDINGQDRVHVLFSGTTLVQASSSDPGSNSSGCVCYVLRTGAMSSQGELIRMVEFSQEDVRADKRDTMFLLLLLLTFALMAVGYVVYGKYSGESEKLSKMSEYRLLLKCVMIITSVVPPELPMQVGREEEKFSCLGG